MEIDQWKDKIRSKEKELVKKTEELSSTLEADRSALTQKLNLRVFTKRPSSSPIY